jgi:hypothetical protein
MLIALLIAARLDEAGAIAVASALLHEGLPPTAVVAALAIGPLARRPFLLLALRSVWNQGVRGWFSPLRHRES